MTVLLDLPGPCVTSPCHKQVTPGIPRREVKSEKTLFFLLPRDKVCFSTLGFGQWKTRDMKMPSPGTTLRWSLKRWPEGLRGPLYSWQHLLAVHKVTTGTTVDGPNLLLEPRMDMNSPTVRCLKGYDPRPFSGERGVTCRIRISLFLLRVLCPF